MHITANRRATVSSVYLVYRLIEDVCLRCVFYLFLVNNQVTIEFFIHYSFVLAVVGIVFSQSRMPQLDKFTYFTQFFWLCLFFFTFYILICNDRDGVLGISRILKLRYQLLSHRRNNLQRLSNSAKGFLDLVRLGFSTGASYMYSSLFEVSQWCNVDLLVKRKKSTLISCFGDISGSRGMERNILSLISKSSYSTGITCKHDIMLLHVVHGQGSFLRP
jgi:F-type H+-transporting ATPase subunit b